MAPTVQRAAAPSMPNIDHHEDVWRLPAKEEIFKAWNPAAAREMRAKFLSTIPVGRFSTPEDMGNAACYLCSDEASMVTGVCMEVDGGRCI